jgi:hypothetical protein
VRPVLQLKPMQVCFVKGVGSPRSHAGHLACKAPVCRSLQPIAWGLREPAQSHMKAERTRSGNHANPDLAKQAGRACAMGANCPTARSAALALQAGLPQAETWSCLTPTLSINESHANSGVNSVGRCLTDGSLCPTGSLRWVFASVPRQSSPPA